MPFTIPADMKSWHPIDVCTWLAGIEEDPAAGPDDVREARAAAAAALIAWSPPPCPTTPHTSTAAPTGDAP